MKKRAIKILSHVFVLSALALFSCSKTETSLPVVVKPPVKDTPVVVPPLPPKDTVKSQTPGITAVKLDNQSGTIKNYQLFIPADYNNKKDTKWPVVFFLHGVGERGTDINQVKNVGIMKVASGKPFLIIAPQCPADEWWNLKSLEILYKEVMAKYNVDINRVYLTGLSMGGFGVWDWSAAYPEKFAATIPICGGGNASYAAKLKDMPIWDFHCADDPTVNVSNSRDMVKALKAVGSKILYTEYPTGGHDAWTRTYANADVYTWLLQQHK
jgi:predicted peptidase